jgi:hypothetical protein
MVTKGYILMQTLSIFFSCFCWSKSFKHVCLKYLGKNHNIIKRNQSTWLICHLVRLSLNQTGHGPMLNHHLDPSHNLVQSCLGTHLYVFFWVFRSHGHIFCPILFLCKTIFIFYVNCNKQYSFSMSIATLLS